VVGVLTPTPFVPYNSKATDRRPMRFPLAMCSDLQTRQIKWISRADQLKNGSRPSAYIHWGLPASVLAAQYAETHAQEAEEALPTW
jgi:hypothetical protein